MPGFHGLLTWRVSSTEGRGWDDFKIGCSNPTGCGAATMLSPSKKELPIADRSPASPCPVLGPSTHRDQALAHWQPLLQDSGISPRVPGLDLKGRSRGIHRPGCLHFPPKPQTHDGGHPGPPPTWCGGLGKNLQITSSLVHPDLLIFFPLVWGEPVHTSGSDSHGRALVSA